MGWSRCAGIQRRPHGRRETRPQRSSPDALHAHHRRIARGRIRSRHRGLREKKIAERSAWAPAKCCWWIRQLGQSIERQQLSFELLGAERQSRCRRSTVHSQICVARTELPLPFRRPSFDPQRLAAALGWTEDQFRLLFQPLGLEGKEAIWSMGDDAPPAFLSSAQAARCGITASSVSRK